MPCTVSISEQETHPLGTSTFPGGGSNTKGNAHELVPGDGSQREEKANVVKILKEASLVESKRFRCEIYTPRLFFSAKPPLMVLPEDAPSVETCFPESPDLGNLRRYRKGPDRNANRAVVTGHLQEFARNLRPAEVRRKER